MESKFNLISVTILILITIFYAVKGDCGNVNPPQNSRITGNCVSPYTRTGAVCEIHCKNSCRLENSQNNQLIIRCGVTNLWDRNPDNIRCISSEPCDSVQIIAGRTYNCLNYFNLGSICSFSCLPGFSAASGLRNAMSCVANDDVNECRKPLWNPPINQIITCNQNRCTDLTLVNGQTVGVCIGAVQPQQCTLTCPIGTYLNLNRAQQLTITCVGSQWDSIITQPPQCIAITCPNLQPPVNGSFTVGSSCAPGIAGRTCSFQCNAGFVLNADITLRCHSNGTWNLGGQVPICILPPPPIMCPELPRIIPFGGIRNLTGCSPSVPGSRCEYSCESINYSLVGGSERFCQISNGQWFPSNTPPNCTRTLCLAKRTIPNGRQIGDCTPGVSGNVCRYVCNATYGLIGTADFLCQPTGMPVGVWQPSSLPGLPEILPSCAQIYCPSIKSGNNSQNVANFSGNCETTIPGSICNIRCTTGYFYSILCQANGAWNDTIKCNATICSYLPYPDNGFNYGVCQANVEVGQVCNFACNDTNSYYLLPQESARVTCTAVGWSNYNTTNPPKCVRFTPCPNIVKPENSNLNGTCAPGKPGETCEFNCDDGYELSGSEVDSMTCHLNGSWIPDTPPSCVEQQCSDVAVNPHVIMSGSCSPGIVNEDCSFSCPPGYTLTGNNKITCGSDLSWSGVPPKCTKLCPPIPIPNPLPKGTKMTRKTCEQRKVNTNCVISCGQGYGLLSKRSSKTLTCRNNGQWNGAPLQTVLPRCLRQCTKLRNTNGRLIGQCGPTGLEGKSCSVLCNSGFRLVGPQKVTCGQNGHWSPSPLPRCLRNIRRFG